MESKSFMAILDEKLIVLVQSYPVLYKLRDKNYKNNFVKENVWQEIATLLNKNISDCKNRWRTIRDSYRKNKNKAKQGSGSAAVTKSKYSDEKLKFLEETFLERPTITNIVMEEKDEDEKYDTVDATSYKENIQTEDNETTNTTETENKKRKKENDTDAEKNNSTGKFIKKRSLILDCNEIIRKKKAIPTQTHNSIKDKILDEVKRGREERLNFMQNMLHKDKKDEPEHPIDTFFKSMASTVKTFPAHLLAETRLKVCKLVTEMEMRALSEISQYTSNSVHSHCSNSLCTSNDQYSNFSSPAAEYLCASTPMSSSVDDETPHFLNL